MKYLDQLFFTLINTMSEYSAYTFVNIGKIDYIVCITMFLWLYSITNYNYFLLSITLIGTH